MKHFSSGMQLRLAFAVAAHLEPEILVIDEVLAVGDAEFQKKCINKMESVSRSDGRTILFVSHNMAAVKQLCTKGVVLDRGEKKFFGDIATAQNIYTGNFLNSVARTTEATFDLKKHPNKIKENEALLNARVYVNGNLSETLVPGAELKIVVSYFLKTPLIDPEAGIVIKDSEYVPIIGLNNKHLGKKLELKSGEPGEIQITIPSLNLYAPGKYLVDLYLGDQTHFFECLYDAFQFTIRSHDVFDSGVEPLPEWNKIIFKDMTITAER
jgi:lipopolysaccharide transport system ATP-binding protein